MQDGAPGHRARATIEEFNSSGLYPIEKAWNIHFLIKMD
jgi:hypothetical protein